MSRSSVRRESCSEFLTVNELAAFLRMSQQWVYQRVREDEIPHIRLGVTIRFRRAAIEEWLKKKGLGRGKSLDETEAANGAEKRI